VLDDRPRWGSVIPGADFNAETGMSISETGFRHLFQAALHLLSIHAHLVSFVD
jgi:hypothetical protein